MGAYKKDIPYLRFTYPSTKLAVLGGIIIILSGIVMLIRIVFSKIPSNYFISVSFIENWIHNFDCICLFLLTISIIMIILSVIWYINMPDITKIRLMIKKRLFCSAFGNPLNLKDGEQLPKIICTALESGRYKLTITATSVTVENIQNISSSISSCLSEKFKQYAVTQTDTDIAYNTVSFFIEDVTVDRSLIVHSSSELKGNKPTLIPIQQGTYINLTTSGSILCCGKTRSGKTTAIISMLISALEWGHDDFGSEVMIIDPKQAELSRLPHVYTLDENGDARGILKAMRHFADTITKRQKILNDLSEKKGDAVKWWDAGMHVSFFFIDEYVACRSLFPKRTSKENADYNLTEFDNIVKRITTMGASAGCYIIISIAEASVEEGGLPSMIRNAMSTKILFRPTLPEGRLVWNTEQLKDFNVMRTYKPGDAWFSSTDGVHDNVSFVHFPIMKFPVYKELGALLSAYYNPV